MTDFLIVCSANKKCKTTRNCSFKYPTLLSHNPPIVKNNYIDAKGTFNCNQYYGSFELRIIKWEQK